MPTIFIYLVALALAATVTLWFAPMALWQGSEQPDTLPPQGSTRVYAQPGPGALQVRHEGSE